MGSEIGRIAHDLSSMLLVILTSSELIEEELGESSPIHPDVAAIKKATQRAQELTRALLTCARALGAAS